MKIINLTRERVWAGSATRRLASLAILLLGGVFIAYVFYSNWGQLQAQRIELNYSYVALAFLMYPVGMLPTAAAWHALLRALGVPTGFRVNLRIYSLSTVPRNIPGFVWFIASRSLLYQEQDISAALVAAASVVETLFLALTGFIVAGLALLSFGGALPAYMGVIRFAPLVAAVLLVVLVAGASALNALFQRIHPHQQIGQVVAQLSKRGVIIALLWMFMAWSGGGLLLFILAQAIVPLDWALLPVVIGIWGAAGAVSLSVGIGIQGMGIREMTLTALLGMLMNPIVALVLAIAFRVLLTAGEFLWALIFIWITRGKAKLG